MYIKKEVVLNKIPVEYRNQYLSNQSMHHLLYRIDVCFLDRIGTINIRGHQCRVSSILQEESGSVFSIVCVDLPIIGIV